MTTAPLAQAQALVVDYHADKALAGVDASFGPGIHGLLGRNGAGKTTLLSAFASLLRPTSGSVQINGENPFERERLMEQVCLIRESGDVLGDEKLKDNLSFQQLARPNFDRSYAETLIDEFGLALKDKPQNLSRGQRSALGVSIGLAARAPITLLDEVHLGMDAPAREIFYRELLRESAEYPRVFVLSSHLINELEPLVETVTILHQGKTLLAGDADDLRQSGATITGPTAAVAELARDHRIIGSRDLGPTRQVTLYDDRPDSRNEILHAAAEAGLDIGPVPLQDLFIHLTDDRSATTGRSAS